MTTKETQGDAVTARCAFCGKKEEVTPVHKDYNKLRLNPKTVYICTLCERKLRFDAEEFNKPKKPM